MGLKSSTEFMLECRNRNAKYLDVFETFNSVSFIPIHFSGKFMKVRHQFLVSQESIVTDLRKIIYSFESDFFGTT